MVMPDGHLDAFQYLHHLIFRIAGNMWIGCGTTDHNRTVKHTTEELGLVIERFIDASRAQYWERGEIVSLYWNQMGLVENWKTKEISGMITSLRNDDLNNAHTAELVATLVLPKDSLKLWETKSTILSYDLNIGNEHGNDKIAAKSE
jgi:hypothetical protein